MKTIIPFLVVGLLLLAACQTTLNQVPVKEQVMQQGLQKFSSVHELKQYLDDNRGGAYNGPMFGMARGMPMDDMMVMESAAIKSAAPDIAGDFSTTNNQVQGVDEADFVKNDGKYIYTIADGQLVIVEAYPPQNAEIMSKIAIDGRPTSLFLNGDTLVVFSVLDDEAQVIPLFDFMPHQRYAPVTHAYIYDISDQEDPSLVEEYSFNGDYFQARMIDDVVYVITRDNVWYHDEVIALPAVRSDEEFLFMPDVFHFNNPAGSYVFHMVAAFDIEGRDVQADTYMMGHGATVYMSQNNLYVAYQHQERWQDLREERFREVILPYLPLELKERIKSIDDLEEEWDQVAMVLADFYGEMSGEERSAFMEPISEELEEYDLAKERERQMTLIHKIAVDGTDLRYVGEGQVSGTLLNQFAMDEHEGNLRVATTLNLWAWDEQTNNVFVLDEDMAVIGKLTGLAEDERIYSTRFMGDKLYMVTFKRIDPLFVISLEDPRNPEVLGELKIPGFSDYLHPYDEDHIIGVGKETKENQWGGISTQGVKIALFDVSDVNNPKEVDTLEIGEPGSDSEALRDHKAFLFDKEKNLLVLPVREITGKRGYDVRRGYSQRVWHGAYVLGLDPDEGFTIRGKVSHFEGDDNYWYGSPSAVRRSLYLDNILYTLSSKKILMHDLDDLEEIGEVKLPFSRDYPVWY